MSVAAGQGYVVETANLAARIWRTGARAPRAVATVPLGGLFRSGGDRLTDPRILYDAPSGRWLASISDIDQSSVLLAVSRGGDPTGPWNVYPFGADGCADQPRLGVSDALVVLAADVYASCDNAFSPVVGGELWIVGKQQLLAGSPAVESTTYGPDDTLSSLTPVQSLSSTSTQYVATVDSPSSQYVRLYSIDGVPPGPVRVAQAAAIPISPLTQPPDAPQPPGPSPGRQPLITTNDERILDAVWEDGRLWLSANTSCIPPGDVRVRSCGRVLELSTATRALDWETDLSQAGAYVFFPNLRPDGLGNVVMVYGESSPTVQPELVTVARVADGTFSAPATIAQSAGSYLGGRYGDYFGAARDPSAPGVVWVAGETGPAGASGEGWSTRLASVVVNGAPAQAVAASAPRLRAQASSGRPGAAVRLVYRALDDGTDVRETVTVTAAGGSSLVFHATTVPGTLHAGQVYYVVWKPAKRLHGAFAFCVAAATADGSRSARSCSTVRLR